MYGIRAVDGTLHLRGVNSPCDAVSRHLGGIFLVARNTLADIAACWAAEQQRGKSSLMPCRACQQSLDRAVEAALLAARTPVTEAADRVASKDWSAIESCDVLVADARDVTLAHCVLAEIKKGDAAWSACRNGQDSESAALKTIEAIRSLVNREIEDNPEPPHVTLAREVLAAVQSGFTQRGLADDSDEGERDLIHMGQRIHDIVRAVIPAPRLAVTVTMHNEFVADAECDGARMSFAKISGFWYETSGAGKTAPSATSLRDAVVRWVRNANRTEELDIKIED